MKTSKVTTLRPMDMTGAQLVNMLRQGKRIPLSARIGRGPLFIVPKGQS